MSPRSAAVILVVDDDAAVRDSIVAILADAGYHVRTATNGAEGIQAMLERRPDAILVDWRMPVMDGLTFCDTQRRLEGFEAIPTIMMSGHEGASAEGLHTAAFLAKPFNMTDLLGEVRAALQG